MLSSNPTEVQCWYNGSTMDIYRLCLALFCGENNGSTMDIYRLCLALFCGENPLLGLPGTVVHFWNPGI